MSTTPVERTKVFISYSHKDVRWLERLRVYLKPLEREGKIERWDDTKIQSGANWQKEISNALAAARVAVLLVSEHFLESDFIDKNELPPLLAAAEKEGVLILPVIVGLCLFERSRLFQFQAVNSPSQPLNSLRRAKQDKVLVKLAGDIEEALKKPGNGPQEICFLPEDKRCPLSETKKLQYKSYVEVCSNYSIVWPNMSDARAKWIGPKLSNKSIHDNGISEIAVVGVACTDVVDLFREIVNALKNTNISFDVFMANPEYNFEKLKDFENREDVSSNVQRPMAERLRKLISYYRHNRRLTDKLRESIEKLGSGNYEDHATCIKVCRDLWCNCEEICEKPSDKVKIYYLNELPWARQWIFRPRAALIYSLYVGHPGVGRDNPAFCHSALPEDTNLESRKDARLIIERAEYYVDQLKKLSTRCERNSGD